jgi:hypothetical protein
VVRVRHENIGWLKTSQVNCRDGVLAPHRQREQLPVLVMQVNPVLTPVLAVRDELEVPAAKRVEGVRHPDKPVPIILIGCS